MSVESLAALSAAFEKWRGGKRHLREAVPPELMERAHAASRRHGPAAVARATRIGRARLFRGGRKEHRGSSVALVTVPRYTCVEVPVSIPASRPFAEVETVTGLKVRLFLESGESVGLLSALLGLGGAQ